MEELRKQIEGIIRSYSHQEHLIDSIDGDDVGKIVEEILSRFFILKENDFDSTIVDKGFTYLVKLKSGRLCNAWYNYHGQWRLNHPDNELAIDKIFTPRIG